ELFQLPQDLVSFVSIPSSSIRFPQPGDRARPRPNVATLSQGGNGILVPQLAGLRPPEEAPGASRIGFKFECFLTLLDSLVISASIQINNRKKGVEGTGQRI